MKSVQENVRTPTLPPGFPILARWNCLRFAAKSSTGEPRKEAELPGISPQGIELFDSSFDKRSSFIVTPPPHSL